MGRSPLSLGAGRKRGGEMGNEETRDPDASSRVVRTEPVPEMRPWLEVGWIFRDGDAHAIERQGTRTRMRTAPVRDE